MTKRIVTVLMMVALVLLAIPSFAAGPSKMPASKSSAGNHTVIGDLSSVDAVAHALTVKVKDASEHFTVDAKAQIVSHGKTMKLADLKSGDRVEVTYTGAGMSRTASRINVLHAKAS
jgi:hypothetical protein